MILHNVQLLWRAAILKFSMPCSRGLLRSWQINEVMFVWNYIGPPTEKNIMDLLYYWYFLSSAAFGILRSSTVILFSVTTELPTTWVEGFDKVKMKLVSHPLSFHLDSQVKWNLVFSTSSFSHCKFKSLTFLSSFFFSFPGILILL